MRGPSVTSIALVPSGENTAGQKNGSCGSALAWNEPPTEYATSVRPHQSVT